MEKKTDGKKETKAPGMTDDRLHLGPSASFIPQPQTMEDAFKLAQFLAQSALVPDVYRGKPADILIAMSYGREIGLKEIQALYAIKVINGMPSVWGDIMLAMAFASGMVTEFSESSKEEIQKTNAARCTVRRKGMAAVFVGSFSKADAEIAKLWGKVGQYGQPSAWVTYPWRMLQMRARGFALRDAFPDLFKGLVTREEVEDMTITAATVGMVGKSQPETQGTRLADRLTAGTVGTAIADDSPLGMVLDSIEKGEAILCQDAAGRGAFQVLRERFKIPPLGVDGVPLETLRDYNRALSAEVDRLIQDSSVS
ncbi:MAG: hypothetical protein ACREI9_05705 [Nitrospiraceae bacterium]